MASSLFSDVQARLQDPEFVKRKNSFLKKTYQFGYYCGKKGLPLRWHNQIKLRGVRFIFKNFPEIKQAKAALIAEGKQLASFLFNKPLSTCNNADVLHLYTYITFIDYETETVKSSGSGDVLPSIDRRVTTLNPVDASTFIEDYLAKGKLNEKQAKTAYNAVLAIQEEVLVERQQGIYVYPRLTFKGKGITKHREYIRLNSMPSAYAPVLMIQGYVKGLRTYIGDDIVKIYYTKVNQESRVQVVTFNQDYIDEVYKGNEYVTPDFYDNLSFDVNKDPNTAIVPLPAGEPSVFLNMDLYLWGGLWRVADFGISPLDVSPLRYISLLRIVKVGKIKYNAKRFKEFTYVNLNEVFPYFKTAWATMEEDLRQVLLPRLIKSFKLDPDITTADVILQLQYHESLGTTFRNKLYRFITDKNNLEFFPNYDALGVEVGSGYIDDTNIEESLTMLDLDLDADALGLDA